MTSKIRGLNDLPSFVAGAKDDPPQVSIGVPAPASPSPAQAATPAPEYHAAPQGERGLYPWLEANPRVKKAFNLRLDESDYLKLKWLGDTQYGESMHSIAIQAVNKAVAERLEALGIEVAGAAGHAIETGKD
jgi:hypothetical protein